MNWNFRVIRRKKVYKLNDKDRIEYEYGIHEAFYDKFKKVIMISDEPCNPSGEHVEELRHNWSLMAEAFGQPILDYDHIPEEGHDKEDPMLVVTEELITKGLVDNKQVNDAMNKMIKEFDWVEFDKNRERVRVIKEFEHDNNFVGIKTFKKLVSKIFTNFEKSKE